MVKNLSFSSTKERNAFIVEKKKEGLTNGEIGKKVGLTERQIIRIYNTFKSSRRLWRKPGSGRNSTLSTAVKKRIKDKLRYNPYKSLNKIRSELHIDAVPKTIRRYLKKIGWSRKKAVKVPDLTRTQKVNRVTWAENHRTYDWRKVIFSDECTFELNQLRYGWAQKGKRIKQKSLCYNPKVQVWGSMCREGMVKFTVFKGVMNSQGYVKILEDGFVDAANEKLGEDWVFQHDNARPHIAKHTKEFLDANVPEVLSWPSGSPDLSPIENLWGKLKQQVYSRNPKDTNQLETFIEEEIAEIPQNFYTNLIDSMKSRTKMVIESEGNTINY